MMASRPHSVPGFPIFDAGAVLASAAEMKKLLNDDDNGLDCNGSAKE